MLFGARLSPSQELFGRHSFLRKRCHVQKFSIAGECGQGAGVREGCRMRAYRAAAVCDCVWLMMGGGAAASAARGAPKNA